MTVPAFAVPSGMGAFRAISRPSVTGATYSNGMRIVIAPDSFKESVTATEAAAALARGVRAVFPDAECVEVPLADGGEGFTEAMADALHGEIREAEVVDCLGRPTTATFALAPSDSGAVAVIEGAKAIGLEMITPEDRDIFNSDTRGLGMLIRAALDAGATELVIGIGGSATNDAGAGMLAELGLKVYNEAGEIIPTTPAALQHAHRIDTDGLDERLAKATIRTACDVSNPLLGENGCSAIFGPQKGATPEDVPVLDSYLEHFASVAGHLDGPDAPANEPGAGAAGGLGYALRAFLDAELRPGIDVVIETVGLADIVAGADLVFTGEGAMDAQTLMGKTPHGVAKVAAEAGIPVIGFAGRIADDADVLYDHGFHALVPIVSELSTQDEALANGARNLERAAERACRLLGINIVM